MPAAAGSSTSENDPRMSHKSRNVAIVPESCDRVCAAARASCLLCAPWLDVYSAPIMRVSLSGDGSSFPIAWVCATICGPLLVVAVVEQNRGCIGRILSSQPMVYLGRRSYALDLCHYLFLTWFRSLGHLGIVYALCCTLIASEISWPWWRVVERRFLRRKVRFPSL